MTTLPLTLFGAGTPAVSTSWTAQRTHLDPCCWFDHAPGFLDGADQLFAELEEAIDWFRGRRLMYGTWHEEPRLTGQEALGDAELPNAVDNIRDELSTRYDRAFLGLFCNYYQSGSDSVAWHADRIGRTEVDPLVAIVSLGGPRTFAMRPQSGGPSNRVQLHSGDLLIMGGAMQHHWEHAIPKTKHAAPRMSVTMRAGGPPLSAVARQPQAESEVPGPVQRTAGSPAAIRASATRRRPRCASTSAPSSTASAIN